MYRKREITGTGIPALRTLVSGHPKIKPKWSFSGLFALKRSILVCLNENSAIETILKTNARNIYLKVFTVLTVCLAETRSKTSNICHTFWFFFSGTFYGQKIRQTMFETIRKCLKTCFFCWSSQMHRPTWQNMFYHFASCVRARRMWARTNES